MTGTEPLLVPQDRQRASRVAKSAHPGATKAPAEIWTAEDKDHALAAVKAFEAAYGAKITKSDREDSTFAAVRHRAKITKWPGPRAAGLATAVKLIESAQDRWRAVNARPLVALVRAGATFINGQFVERPSDQAEPEAA